MRANQLASTHPISIAINRLKATDRARCRKPGQPRQLETITNSIPANNSNNTERIVPYRFRPWDSPTYTVTISKKTKEEEAIAHTAYTQSRLGDNYIAIYSDASQVKDGKGIGVGLVAYNSAQEETYTERTNIGKSQLVYNGELEGITRVFEYAARIAEKDQEINVFADNQAAVYRLRNLSDNPGQQWLIRCLKAAESIQAKKALICLL
ncbi:hypothetical protein IG631_24143 [Alternaria alternata]|nr:hypothetical protein IG631_24143 [Alternaria alternata]OWY54917.1 hypothetical protein AALT_g11745 [Alternaria alternata]